MSWIRWDIMQITLKVIGNHLVRMKAWEAMKFKPQSPPPPQGDNQTQPQPPPSPSREMLVDEINHPRVL
ncbi:hypothetical protein Tco_1120653 [Tanacetum coccineum]